jgi:hypothetical protein
VSGRKGVLGNFQPDDRRADPLSGTAFYFLKVALARLGEVLPALGPFPAIQTTDIIHREGPYR